MSQTLELSRDQLAEEMGLIVAGTSLVDPDTGAVVLEANAVQTFEMAVRACARMHATANQATAIAAEIQRLQAKLRAVQKRAAWLESLYKEPLATITWQMLSGKYGDDPEKWPVRSQSFTYATVQFVNVPERKVLGVDATDPELIKWAKRRCPDAIKPPSPASLYVSKVPDGLKRNRFFSTEPATRRVDIKIRTGGQ